jgi:hypothetical protein
MLETTGHVEYIAPPAAEMLAYTRYVLDAGMRGDLLTLRVALAPCVVGYAEIAARLAARPDACAGTNPYSVWIDEFAGGPYQEVAAKMRAHLEPLTRNTGEDPESHKPVHETFIRIAARDPHTPPCRGRGREETAARAQVTNDRVVSVEGRKEGIGEPDSAGPDRTAPAGTVPLIRQ